MKTRIGHHAPRLGMAALGAAIVVFATACPPSSGGGTGTTTTTVPVTTIPGTPNTPPIINSFTATTTSESSPLTTALTWNITEVDGNPMTCGLDLDDNGTYEITIPGCTSDSTRSTTYTALGIHTIRFRVSDGVDASLATTTVNVGAASSDAFNITVRLDGTMTPSQQAAFTDAAARWAQAIKTGEPSVSLNIPANDCGTGAPAFNGTIDDILIDAAISPIDGVGSILGQSGPCYVRTSNGLPVYGAMQFDVADVAGLEANGTFDEVILHEMGHVLGIGTVWNAPTLTGSGTADPRFTGPVAVGAWRALGGVGAVPVENSGGPGTVNSHWRESVFNAELMTGYIDATNPMSQVTIGSLADIGYGVDLSVADPYSLPALMAERAAPATSVDDNMILIHPKGSR